MSKMNKNGNKKNLSDSNEKKFDSGKLVTWGIVFIVAVLFVVNNWNCKDEKLDFSGKSDNQPSMSQEASQPTDAPDFSLPDINGKTIKLSDYKNKTVILDFWATWCPPCIKGIPDLIALQKENPDVQIIGISVDQENTKGNVPGFVKEKGINYPVVYATPEIIDAYGGITNIPTSFIISKERKITGKYVGLVEKSVYETMIKKGK